MPTLSPAWPWVQQLAEHLHARAHRLLRGADAHDLDFFAHLDHATLHAPGHHRAAPGDAEHVFHRHQERAVDRPLGRGNVAVQRLGQLQDRAFAEFALVAFHRQLGAAVHDGRLVTGEIVLVQQFAHFHLDEFEQLRVVHHVALVQVHDDVGHAHLARSRMCSRVWGIGPSAADCTPGWRRPSAPHP
jgi:hypothetical protein